MKLICSLVIIFFMTCSRATWAGPPFVTDDPEPVEPGHWETYISSTLTRDSSGRSGALPHLEVNHGPAPNLQLHIILPYAFSKQTGEPESRGLGDAELGVKYRFLQETKRRPMVGIFPLVETPTGSSSRGLGSGHLQLFLPIWVQKSWGPWTTYGGGGYFINPGPPNRDYWLLGWELQKDLNKRLTLGGEIFGTTPVAVDAPHEFNFNIGGYYNFNDGHHLLFSAGRSIRGDVKLMTYIGYQWTFASKQAR
jgi:hypothetical protein